MEDEMKNAEVIKLVSERVEYDVNVRTILYVVIHGNMATVHRSDGAPLDVRMTLMEFERRLGSNFIKIKRNCIVSVYAIHNITTNINLCNGEELEISPRTRYRLRKEFHEKQRIIIKGFKKYNAPMTPKEYKEHYKVFDKMPFAFTDIEMVFDEKLRAVDWVFRYGNKALADLEMMPLKKMIGKSFSHIFPNMDSKWLRTYERATLFEEMLSIIDYSPEIGTNLNVICFPTFKGHCGCILLNVDTLRFFRRTDDSERAIATFIQRLLGEGT